MRIGRCQYGPMYFLIDGCKGYIICVQSECSQSHLYVYAAAESVYVDCTVGKEALGLGKKGKSRI